MKKETWKQIFQIVLTILTALGTTLGVTSCMGRNSSLLITLKQKELWQQKEH